MRATGKIKIGFSTNDFYESKTDLPGRLKLIRNLGCRAAEIGFLRLAEFYSGHFEKLTADDFRGLEYVSFHAPKCDYGDNRETADVFKKISKIDSVRKLNAVVFHPDMVSDFTVFGKAGFNVAFENMDCRKQRYKMPDDLVPLFAENGDFKLTLDLNHVFSNDPTMAMAEEFYQKLGDRISHIHLSGYAGRHEPLFQTKQLKILRAIKRPEIPIIIESTIPPEDAARELEYILKNIKV